MVCLHDSGIAISDRYFGKGDVLRSVRVSLTNAPRNHRPLKLTRKRPTVIMMARRESATGMAKELKGTAGRGM